MDTHELFKKIPMVRSVIYTVSKEDIERSSMLEESDLGRKYVVIKGTIFFLDNS